MPPPIAALFALAAVIAAALAFVAYVRRNPRRFLPMAERRTLEAVDVLPLMIWAADENGDREQLTLSVGGGLSAYGVKPGELVGRDLDTLSPDGKASPSVAAVRRVIASGTPELIVAPRPTVSGTPRHYITYIGRTPDGRVVGVTAMTMDVTGLVEAKLAAEREVDRLTRHASRLGVRAKAAEDEAEALRLRNLARTQYDELMRGTLVSAPDA